MIRAEIIGELWVCGTLGRKARGLAISLLVSLASEEMFDGAFGLDNILEKTIGNGCCGLLEGLSPLLGLGLLPSLGLACGLSPGHGLAPIGRFGLCVG